MSPAPRKPARIPFDPSYPAHLKVLLSSLVRSVEPSQVGAFGEALQGCLDFLLRFCTGAAVGGLHQLGELALPVSASEAPSMAETLKLLRYAVFAWESKPTHPMRRLLRSCFFEPGEVPAPLLHTRWLGVAGYPLENGLSVEDLTRWAEVNVVEVRTEYVEVLASWLKAVRPMFVHLGRQYEVEGERVSVQLSLQGQVFPLLPPWPAKPWGLAFGAARLEEIERAQGLPGPARPEAPAAFVVPPETPGMPAHLRVLLARARDFAAQGKVEPLARTTVHALSFLLRFSSSLLAGALAPLEEPGRALAVPGGDPVRLLHFCVFALAQQPTHPLRPRLQAVFFGGTPPSPRIHTRWLGIAGTPVQVDGLGVWEQRVAAHGPVAPDQVGPLLTLLTEWLGSLRDVFASGGLQVAGGGDGTLALEATLDGRTFPLIPPVAVGALDFQLSAAELEAEGRDAFWEPERFTESGPAKAAAEPVTAEPAESVPATAAPPAAAGSAQAVEDLAGAPEAAPAPEQASNIPTEVGPAAEAIAEAPEGAPTPEQTPNIPTEVGADIAITAESEQPSNAFPTGSPFDSLSNTEAPAEAVGIEQPADTPTGAEAAPAGGAVPAEPATQAAAAAPEAAEAAPAPEQTADTPTEVGLATAAAPPPAAAVQAESAAQAVEPVAEAVTPSPEQASDIPTEVGPAVQAIAEAPEAAPAPEQTANAPTEVGTDIATTAESEQPSNAFTPVSPFVSGSNTEAPAEAVGIEQPADTPTGADAAPAAGAVPAEPATQAAAAAPEAAEAAPAPEQTADTPTEVGLATAAAPPPAAAVQAESAAQAVEPVAEAVTPAPERASNIPTEVGPAAEAIAEAPEAAPAPEQTANTPTEVGTDIATTAESEQPSNAFTPVSPFVSGSNSEAPAEAVGAASEQVADTLTGADPAPAAGAVPAEPATQAAEATEAVMPAPEQASNTPTEVGPAAPVAPPEPTAHEQATSTQTEGPTAAEAAPAAEQPANTPASAEDPATASTTPAEPTAGAPAPEQSEHHPTEGPPETPSAETRPAALALEVAPLRPQAWPPAVRASLEKRAIDQEAQTPPLFIVEEAIEYLSTRNAEPLVVEGATGVGKTYAARALQGWPSAEPRPLVLFEWTSTHPLERLNEQLNALHLGLGADVIADLNRVHPQPAQRWRAFYGTLLMKNPEGLTLILDEPRLEAVEHQPEGLQLILCQSHVGAGVRLPIHHEHAGYQKYAVAHVQQIAPFLDATKAQAVVEHGQSKLAAARLLAEGLVANLFPRTQWPQPLEPSLLMGLGSHARALLLTLATADEMRADLLEDLGITPEAFETFVPGLLVKRSPLTLQLATPQLKKTLIELLPGPFKTLCAQLTRRGMELQTSPELLYRWALHSDDLELLHELAQDPAIRKHREETCAAHDAEQKPHRKIDVLDGWIAILNRLVKANRAEHCEALAWAYSSRALTWLGQGCLEPALADVEQALAWFRELVENQGQDALINGLAAASNRRSEILKSLKNLEEASHDATAAIRAYTVAVEKQKRHDLEPLLALAYHNRASVQRERGQFDAAEADATRAIELYRPWVDKLSQRILLDLARTYQTRAQLALDRDEGVQARDDAQRAMDVMARIQQGDPRIDNARAARLRAEAHYRMAEFATAIPDFDHSLALWRPLIAEGRLDLRAELTRDLCRQASAYARLDEQEAALTAFQEAIELSRQLVELEGRADLAELLGVALMGRAEILASFGLASEAAVDLLAALEQLGQSFERARALARLGELELELGEAMAAAGHLEQAEALLAAAEEPLTTSREAYRTSGLRERRARILALLGQAHREIGSHTASAAALDRAVELFGHLVDEEGRQDLLAQLARVHLGRAQALVHDNDFDTAQNDANQAVELLSYLFEGGSAEFSAQLASAWALKAELHGRTGHFDEALKSWEQALEHYRYLQYQVELARCYHGKGRMLGAAGHPASALEALGVALTHFEAAVDLNEDDRRRWGECLLDRSRQNLAAGLVDEGIADALAALDKTVGLDDSGALENLLASLEERAEASLRQGLGADAAAAYTQIIEISQALSDKLSGADLKTLQSRAHQRRAEARRSEGLLELACEDLTWSLTHLAQLAGLEGGDTVWLEQAQLFELRAELNRERGASERATLDLGRAIEALRRVRTPKDPVLSASFERRQAGLFVDRADLCRARGDLAESWQDLTVANAALLSQVALPDPEVQRLLARASIGLAETILWMGRPLDAAEEYLRGARLLKKLASDSPEFQALHAHCLLERLPLVDVAEFTPALTDAIAALPPLVQAWAERVPAEAVRQSLESEPEADRAYRLARAWLSLLEAWPDGPEGWAEMLPTILAHAARHSREADVEMAGRVARLLLRRGAGEAAPRPWMGTCFASLARVAEGLKAGADRESLRELGRTWSGLSPHLQAMAGIMPNHLETLCAS